MRNLPTYVDTHQLFGRHGFTALDWTGRTLLRGAEPTGGHALEIGAGDGILSLWMLHAGALTVTSLEPEADGSTAGVGAKAARHREHLQLENDRWIYRPDTLQTFDADRAYRVVLSHDSINHLDEDACIDLQYHPGARARYETLFAKVHDLLAPGGSFVFSDCARVNYWDRLGRPSPWAPEIEWHKHQEPEVWCELLRSARLEPTSVRWWHPFYRLRTLGPLLRTKLAARCLASYFVVTARRTP